MKVVSKTRQEMGDAPPITPATEKLLVVCAECGYEMQECEGIDLHEVKELWGVPKEVCRTDHFRVFVCPNSSDGKKHSTIYIREQGLKGGKVEEEIRQDEREKVFKVATEAAKDTLKKADKIGREAGEEMAIKFKEKWMEQARATAFEEVFAEIDKEDCGDKSYKEPALLIGYHAYRNLKKRFGVKL
ncbi:MAG: hypothetical protein NT130_03505 [Candidatus Micrarchaeota archaeon]|nr:hypothetical protein [Candidatus Micrarchaeota archaeon]